MGRTVAELKLTVSAKELAQWWAYNKISPIGDDRADLLNGILVAKLSNLNRKKNSDRIYRPIDFMPFASRKTRTHDLSEKIKANFKAYQPAGE